MNDAPAGMQTESISVDYDLTARPDTVWRALTQSDLIAQWLMSNDFQPVVGHRFTFQAKAMEGWDGRVHCEVLEVDEPHRLSYSWRGGAGEYAIDTVVTWTLTPNGTGTLLHLEHSGFQPKDRMGFEGLNKGWRSHIATRIVEVTSRLDGE
jgi:uncharacterized protein YndB with AHSA1/START domain